MWTPIKQSTLIKYDLTCKSIIVKCKNHFKNELNELLLYLLLIVWYNYNDRFHTVYSNESSAAQSKININTDAGLHVVIELLCKHIYTITLCVCVNVRKTPESGSLVVLSTRQYRLLLNEKGLSMILLGNWTLQHGKV